ncbi:CAP domain-containing protein [Bacillus toyonensis]|uniref:CAP domain-containing protein n=1 Tax=Bacillus toyonensis TaxID=155322 RepID=UPI000BFD78F4|nr:CAP domain-containing protein [Bacillus toyonensis]PHG57795.1 serine protease [Bacillus toyonensis]
MKKRVLLSVATTTALTLGISYLDVQAATIQPSNLNNLNINNFNLTIKLMNQQNYFTPSQNVVTERPTAQLHTHKPTEKAKSLNEFEQRVIELTNVERVKLGLPALQIETELSKVARIKSEDMQKNNYFDHTSPTYGSPFDMINKFGIFYTSAGENIAQGQPTPEEVVQAWMNSAGHRANILNNGFTHIGVGYVESGNYWTQQFITK